MLPGETVLSSGTKTCRDCESPLPLTVLMSAAGYYIGTACNCGPYSRESGYFPSHGEALSALNTLLDSMVDGSPTPTFMRNTNYNGKQP